MADEDVIIDEIQAEPIETGSEPIADLIDAIKAQDFNSAESQFNDLIGDRLSDTLDQAKLKIADEIFNAQAETWEEAGDDEIDIDAAIDAVFADSEVFADEV